MSQFVDHVLELMNPFGAVSARRMFGGFGIHRDGHMFALVADDTLYLKIDAETRQRFAQAGSKPFVYQRPQKLVEMSYWTVPTVCLDDPAEMARWCQLAFGAALRAASGRRKSAKTRKGTAPKVSQTR